jgi:hypothetical protein
MQSDPGSLKVTNALSAFFSAKSLTNHISNTKVVRLNPHSNIYSLDRLRLEMAFWQNNQCPPFSTFSQSPRHERWIQNNKSSNNMNLISFVGLHGTHICCSNICALKEFDLWTWARAVHFIPSFRTSISSSQMRPSISSSSILNRINIPSRAGPPPF